MKTTQEPKYDITNHGSIFNRASREKIPGDEPIMIFRARDIHAAKMIREYSKRVADDEHREVVLERAADFERFALDHPERMKEPDTVLEPQTPSADE